MSKPFSRRPYKILRAAFWIATFGLPLLLLFARPRIALEPGPFADFYAPLAAMLGEKWGRATFCLLWLALDGAFFWMTEISKRRHEIDGSSIDDPAD